MAVVAFRGAKITTEDSSPSPALLTARRPNAIIGAVGETGNGERRAGATGRRPIALAPVASAVLSAELILVAGNGRGVSHGSGEGHGDLAVPWRCRYVSGRTGRLQGCALKIKGCAINFEVVDMRGKR